MGEPAGDRQQHVLLVPASVCAALGCDGERRGDSGAESQPAERPIEGAREAGEGNEENVREDELDICAGEGEGESATVSTTTCTPLHVHTHLYTPVSMMKRFISSSPKLHPPTQNTSKPTHTCHPVHVENKK